MTNRLPNNWTHDEWENWARERKETNHAIEYGVLGSFRQKANTTGMSKSISKDISLDGSLDDASQKVDTPPEIKSNKKYCIAGLHIRLDEKEPICNCKNKFTVLKNGEDYYEINFILPHEIIQINCLKLNDVSVEIRSFKGDTTDKKYNVELIKIASGMQIWNGECRVTHPIKDSPYYGWKKQYSKEAL